ncbi:rhomboid family intramembrane serine protease [Hassallia byssoidea VB512170]|uniref:Rhomboid family intramembrane serine protease n=1 Tax=Hassallia byssoidea VB512170 TaxID=1304833 RepID=A0A846HAV7_9CYAN|nr:rhomboid family intramembrane serine protease [Hassalia byssoidea]NEU74472.1 rhomboid family intramembrane serine protease [Hassalia byssoidea VB512170]
MDINNLLIWIVCLSCVTTTISAVRNSFHHNRGWIFVSTFIFVVTAVTSYLIPNLGGLVGGCFWVIFILIPNFANRKVNQLVAQQRYHQASKLAQFVSWLHPADGLREKPEMLRALDLGQQGAIAEALAILNRYKTTDTPTGRLAIVTLYQIDARWEEMLVWIQENLSEARLQKDSEMLLYYLRSLGETGDLNSLLHAWEYYERSIEQIPNLITRNLARMFVLAFCGQIEQVKTLINGSLRIYSPTIQVFWLATANLAAGNELLGREQLLSIRNSNDIRYHGPIERRLSQPVVEAETILTDKSKQILSRIAAELLQEAKYSGKADLTQPKPNATYFIIGLNLFAFALEIQFGGSTNFLTLYRLGALVPTEVLKGDWWRLFTAAFLHFGFLHLLMNMFGLYVFGRLVEFNLGIARYLILYLTTGLGSMLAVTFMSVMGYSKTEFVVGASGCVMGLVGAFAAILFYDWLRHKTRIASKSLRGILSLIMLQAIFDLTTPQISFVGHTSGVIIGFVVGFLLKVIGK